MNDLEWAKNWKNHKKENEFEKEMGNTPNQVLVEMCLYGPHHRLKWALDRYEKWNKEQKSYRGWVIF